MKTLNIYHIFVLFSLLYISHGLSTGGKANIRSESNKPKWFNEDTEMTDSNRRPIIHIHMEDYDSDPINFKRFDGERKTYQMRLNEVHEKYENDKKALMDVIALQQSKIAHLSDIAAYTNKAIEIFLPTPVQVEEGGNQRKDFTDSTTLHNN